MKSNTHLSIALVMMLASSAALAQTKLNPFAGEVRDLYAVNATTWLAATQGGAVYRTTNSGSAWAPAGSSAIRKAMRYVNKCAGVGATVYCATGNGVFKSGDGGVNWSQLTYDAAATVAADPANANNVLVGVKGVGVLRSTDGGASFTVRSGVAMSGDIRVIHFYNSSTAYAGLVAGAAYPSGEASGGGVFRSTDGGNTWADITAAPATRKVSALTTDTSGSVYTSSSGTGEGAVYKYNGSAWSKTNTFVSGAVYAEWGATQLYRDAANRIWMPSIYGVFVTADGGTTWSPSNAAQGFLNTTRTNAVFSPGGTTLVRAVAGIGLWQTTTLSGSTATELNNGLGAGRVRAMDLVGSELLAGGQGAGVSSSSNGGTSWSRRTTGLGSVVSGSSVIPVEIKDVTHLSAAGSTAYAAADLGGVYRYNSSTSSWAIVDEAGINGSGINNTGFTGGTYFIRPGGLLALASGEVLYSVFDGNGAGGAAHGVWYRNAGGSWSQIVGSPATPAYGMLRVLQAGANGRVFAVRNAFLPYMGQSASALAPVSSGAFAQTSINAPFFVTIAAPGAGDPINGVVVAATSRGIYRSANGGVTWLQLPAAGLANLIATGLAYDASGRLYAGDADGDLYCSNDNGTNFVKKATASSSAIHDLKYVNSTLHVLTDGDGVIAFPNPTCP